MDTDFSLKELYGCFEKVIIKRKHSLTFPNFYELKKDIILKFYKPYFPKETFKKSVRSNFIVLISIYKK